MESGGKVASPHGIRCNAGSGDTKSNLDVKDSEIEEVGHRFNCMALSNDDVRQGPRTSPIPHIEVYNVISSDSAEAQENTGGNAMDEEQDWPGLKSSDALRDPGMANSSFRRKSEGDIQFLTIREDGAVGGYYTCEYTVRNDQKAKSYDSPLCPLSPWRKKRSNSLTYDIGLPREFPLPMTKHVSDNKVVPAARRRSFTAELQTLEPIVEDSFTPAT